MEQNKLDVVLGLQWGDEGKGKVVDVLTPSYKVVARFQGGPNAGHSLVFDGDSFVLHTVPSGIFREGTVNVIGNGVVIDPVILLEEVHAIEQRVGSIGDKLKISKRAHLILPTHRMLDAASEAAKGKSKIGSTLKGIGPTYMDKTGRNGYAWGTSFPRILRTSTMRSNRSISVFWHNMTSGTTSRSMSNSGSRLWSSSSVSPSSTAKSISTRP